VISPSGIFRRLVLLALVMSVVTSCQGRRIRPPAVAEITGRVVIHEEPLHGATVGAFPRPDLNRVQPTSKVITDREGHYRMTLFPGTYYLAVFGLEKNHFAYSGLNPLTVEAGGAYEVGFRASRIAHPAYLDTGERGPAVTGRTTLDGAPLEGARVYLYLDAEEDFRGPGYAYSMPADGEGRFFVDGVPPGEYYLVGRKRKGDRLVGPVSSGDLYGYYPFNPVEVRSGRTLEVEIPCIVKKKELYPSGGATVVRGTLRDREGRLVGGAYAFVYTDEVVGHEKPLSVSPVTGSDGRYVLRLPGGGTFYLGAREEYGINPQPREQYGLYPGTPDHSVLLEAGKDLEGVDIILEEILGWDD
jgi:hypothetical protein